MKIKKCSLCKKEKEIDCFGNSSKSKDGKRSQCKECEANYRNSIKQTVEPCNLKTCSKCKQDKLLEEFNKNRSQKDGYCNTCKECVKDYYKNNSDKILSRNASYRNLNKEKILLHRRLKHKELYDNPLYKLSVNIKNSIRNSILYSTESVRTEEILGCGVNEFRAHIESQFLNWMNWDNHGNVCESLEYNCSWDLDHIIPISYARTEEEIYLLNHWSNFQPLCSKINRGSKNSNVYPLTNLELNITIN